MSNPNLPASWSDWPQSLKLAVPGDHDQTTTFDELNTWISNTPWRCHLNDIVFIGIDTRMGWAQLAQQIENSLCNIERLRALALLFHHWPNESNAAFIASLLKQYAHSLSILVMHGHIHPRNSEDPEWDDQAKLAGLPCYRSKMISSARRSRGSGALITWDGSRFRHKVVQGSLQI